jgi:DNA-binding transcriptional MocR family regulator
MSGKTNSPPGLQSWLPHLQGQEGPLYRVIADAIAAAIAAGTLRDGERLPTHRALADALGIDLTTVTRAYGEAQRRGLAQATVGRGTFVRAAASRSAEAPIDLGMILPPVPTDPPLPILLAQSLSQLLGAPSGAGLLAYRTGSGTGAERSAAAIWLHPVLGEVDPARILLSPGAQPALLAVLSCLAQRGDTILTDGLTYPPLRGLAAQLGLRLAAVAGDGEGMLPDALQAAHRTQRPKAVYLVPTIHNPTTATMGQARRHAIAAAARQEALPIIEDDAYGLLPAAKLPALANLAPELTWHIATVSKVLSPALRVACLVAPDGAIARLGATLRAQVLMASPLLTSLFATWVRDGTAHAVLTAIRRESAARQRLAAEALPTAQCDAHPEGLHLWLRLPTPWDRRDFVAALRQQASLAVVPSDAFAVDPAAAPQAVRLALGAASSRDSLRDALHAIARILSNPPTPFSDIV